MVDFYTALAYVGAVNTWRGVWQLYDLYLLPGQLKIILFCDLNLTVRSFLDQKVLSCFITHAAGLVLLSVCYCAHSILVRGVYLDAEEAGGRAAIQPYFYVRYFAQRRRAARQQKVTDEDKGGARRQAENGWVASEAKSEEEVQAMTSLQRPTNNESSAIE